ncbi:lipoprotein [Spiroplasma endosymbiont of Panorpa germanica]|uniref:lipoprotein n=1 Tax=Spiroplasma endosymbiont of Panorpa germanica TaxID=3066314 RepID=UPI0030D29569
MKKLLSIIASASLTTSSAMAVVACGGVNNSTTIYYSYVDNRTDKNTLKLYTDAAEEYARIYGDDYKFKGIRYDDNNQLSTEMQTIGNSGRNMPDIFIASVDNATKLATLGYILPLDGADAIPEAGEILTNLNYTREKADKAIGKWNDQSATQTDLWSNFMPFAIQSSKIKSNNPKAKEKNPAQYGITTYLGVGGGSALVSNSDDSMSNFKKLGLVNSGSEFNDEGEINWVDNANVSVDKLAEVSAQTGNKMITSLFDRGMWWMYPVYSNIMSDPINGKVYKAADIGVNWINNESLPYYDSSEGKYSSVFSNKYFTTSAKEVLGKWFDYYSQQIKVAKNTLTGKTANTSYLNMNHPSLNAGVQRSMLSGGDGITKDGEVSAFGINYEPSSYFDMLGGFKSFTKIDYMPLEFVKLFDKNNEAEQFQKYDEQNIGKWLAPAGSGMTVFNSRLGANTNRLKAAQRFVEIMFGAHEVENEQGEVEMVHASDGGQWNFEKSFTKSLEVPSKLAIIDPRQTENEIFENKLKEIADNKFARAVDEVANFEGKNNEATEKEAIIRLEKYQIRLASVLYASEDTTLSMAPNVSSYDFATNNDWHGNNAMLPSLNEAFSMNDFEKYYGSLSSDSTDYKKTTEYIEKKEAFAKNLMRILSQLNYELGKK